MGRSPWRWAGHETVQLGSDDLEAGNVSKGLPEGVGDGEGDWRLKLVSGIEVEALAYVRAEDGFVTSMHEVAQATRGAGGMTLHHVPYFIPGSDRSRASRLRLINPGAERATVTIAGRDSTGTEAPEGVVSLVLPAGRACVLSARALESGDPEPGPGACAGEDIDVRGRLGEGAGAWSLSVAAEGGDVRVMSLLESSDGHLVNLSGAGRRRVH